MSFARYPAYKDSGVEWLGEVPGHWDIWKLAQGCESIGSGTTPKTENILFYEEGEIPWVNTGDLNDSDLLDCNKRITELAISQHSTLKLFPKDAVVIAMYGATIGKLAILKFRATVNQACCVFAGNGAIDKKFLFFWLMGFREQIVSLATGGGQPNISQEILRSLKLACPDLAEQQAIATFLDIETAKIDGLMAEQRALVALLKEKRQAVISHAVTKGLNPAAPMKDSGVAWLGEVPGHWAVKRIKHLTSSFEQGWSPQCEGFPVESENEWGVLKVGCVNGGTFRPEENKTLPAELEPIPALSISAGDLLISRANTRELVGSTAVATRDYSNLLLCDKLYRARFHKGVCEPMFIGLYLGTNLARSQIELAATGASSSMVNIGQSIILEMELGLPTLVEQHAIVEFINDQTAQLDTLTQEAQTAIALLQERRTALISAAVTGKMDVRAVVAA